MCLLVFMHSSLSFVLVLLKVGLVVYCVRTEPSKRNAIIYLEGEHGEYSGTVLNKVMN